MSYEESFIAVVYKIWHTEGAVMHLRIIDSITKKTIEETSVIFITTSFSFMQRIYHTCINIIIRFYGVWSTLAKRHNFIHISPVWKFNSCWKSFYCCFLVWRAEIYYKYGEFSYVRCVVDVGILKDTHKDVKGRELFINVKLWTRPEKRHIKSL